MPELIAARRVETQELLIKDETGKLRAFLLAGESASGQPRGRLKGLVPSLVLFNDEGREAVRLRVGLDGQPSLVMQDGDRREFAINFDPSPSMRLVDDGVQLLQLYVSPQRTAGITLWGPQPGDKAELATHKDSSSSLVFRRSNLPRVLLGDDPILRPPHGGEQPRLLLLDSSGKTLREIP